MKTMTRNQIEIAAATWWIEQGQFLRRFLTISELNRRALEAGARWALSAAPPTPQADPVFEATSKKETQSETRTLKTKREWCPHCGSMHVCRHEVTMEFSAKEKP